MEFAELIGLLGNPPCGGVGQLGGDGATEMAGIDLEALVGDEGFGRRGVSAHG